MERQTGVRDKRLDSVKIPAGLEYLWDIYFEMRRGKAIEWRDFADYERATGVTLSAWESGALIQMDTAVEQYLAERNSNHDKQRPS